MSDGNNSSTNLRRIERLEEKSDRAFEDIEENTLNIARCNHEIENIKTERLENINAWSKKHTEDIAIITAHLRQIEKTMSMNDGSKAVISKILMFFVVPIVIATFGIFGAELLQK